MPYYSCFNTSGALPVRRRMPNLRPAVWPHRYLQLALKSLLTLDQSRHLASRYKENHCPRLTFGPDSQHSPELDLQLAPPPLQTLPSLSTLFERLQLHHLVSLNRMRRVPRHATGMQQAWHAALPRATFLKFLFAREVTHTRREVTPFTGKL
jgi:hypothetical protein